MWLIVVCRVGDVVCFSFSVLCFLFWFSFIRDEFVLRTNVCMRDDCVDVWIQY